MAGLVELEDEMWRRIPAMREAAVRGDAPALERLAAQLRSRARALGADRCAEACGELETVGRQGAMGEAPVFLAQLEDELDRLRLEVVGESPTRDPGDAEGPAGYEKRSRCEAAPDGRARGVLPVP